MLKNKIFKILLTFILLFSLPFSQMAYASLLPSKPLKFGDPKLPPPKQASASLTPGERYQLHCANQQLQQSMNNLVRAGYNIGATLAILSKK